jgi:hypothetical protein
MADSFPGGAFQSFAGVVLADAPIKAAAVGYPSVTDTATEAIENTLGLYPVDLYGSTTPPSKRVLTVDVLLAAAESSSTPWSDIIASLNALRALPWTGTLVVRADANSGSNLSAQARRGGIPQTISPATTRHLVVKVSFTILSGFS